MSTFRKTIKDACMPYCNVRTMSWLFDDGKYYMWKCNISQAGIKQLPYPVSWFSLLENMTLTAYLSLLSLGSSIQLRSNDDEDEQEEQIAQLQRREKDMLQAQHSVISAISQHSTSSDMRGIYTLYLDWASE